jgi:hypothetical protein
VLPGYRFGGFHKDMIAIVIKRAEFELRASGSSAGAQLFCGKCYTF